jgi:hypothetical protein
MNDANNIKYECPYVGFMRDIKKNVPYLSINSFGVIVQGAVSLFDLWNAIRSPNRAYELVRTGIELPSTASHGIVYNEGDRTSASHCQDGQNANVYELRILPIDPRIKAATKIQSVLRGHMTRKSKRKGGKSAGGSKRRARKSKKVRPKRKW